MRDTRTMAFLFEFTRTSAEEWRGKADALMRNVRAWREAVRADSRDPAEVKRLAGRTWSTVFRSWGVGFNPELRTAEWEDFAEAEPALAEAVVPFGRAMSRVGVTEWEEWVTWDGTPFEWEAEVQASLEQLTLVLAGGGPRPEPKIHGGAHYEVPEQNRATPMSEKDISDALHRGERKTRPYAARFVEYMIGRPEADMDALAAHVYGHGDCNEKENALHSLQVRVHKYMKHYKSKVRYRIAGVRVYKYESPA